MKWANWCGHLTNETVYKGYIDTLKENHRMSELLHREEIERVEMEKQLSGARLELLKSQINPHFLFNIS